MADFNWIGWPLSFGLPGRFGLESVADFDWSAHLNGNQTDEAGAKSSCRCLGDPKLMRTVMQNLLKNALESSPPEQAMHLHLAEGGGCLTVEIKNKGAVPAEIRDNFFDKYTTKGKSGGTGLGTYSAMMMVKAQGGNITMRTSDEDNETVVTVTLPC